ncbi:bacterioferritin-associated ferredoxin [Polystyrenella longa]|uniref:Bacterioferritin-associated ferredoxin n=1 Tax=Polystyrenella longa TaxID=2528007 RepID=A0A518CR29_9PLAN|nr:(2Fe-2S)-binding protein [Polystyrenella longa]QDU81668.1 bacterioferritin-associated ferredoxin [Polystyrenella longa]
MKPDDHVCLCFHISRRKIENYIRIYQPKRASQVSECGGAGSGCGWCIPFLKRYFEQAQSGQGVDDLTAEEYAQARGQYIHSGKGTPPPGATPPPQNC